MSRCLHVHEWIVEHNDTAAAVLGGTTALGAASGLHDRLPCVTEICNADGG